MSESSEDKLSRLEQMVADKADTWDLSANDKEAIAWAVKCIAALKLASTAMNLLGDTLNGMDACTPEIEAATTPAYYAIRDLFGNKY